MNQDISMRVFHECSGLHAHDYPQILVPIRDSMSIQIGEENFEVSPKELGFIPQGMKHQCNFHGELLAMNLTGDLSGKDSALLTYPVILSMHGQIMHLVELIQTELKQNQDSSAVRHLYRFLYSKLMENCAAPSIRYISEHYDLPITVNQLAEIERYNVTYYNDWFKQQTGISPSLYLRRTRVRKAQELLAHTDYGVTDIAIMVGYSSNSTFTRAFHSITGMTPKAYRDCACLERIG